MTTLTESSATAPATSYNALEQTITVDGGWPVCAGCGEPGSHEECIAEDTPAAHHRDATARARVGRRPGVQQVATSEVRTIGGVKMRYLRVVALPATAESKAVGGEVLT